MREQHEAAAAVWIGLAEAEELRARERLMDMRPAALGPEA
jgi:hypothetical protein